MTLTQVNEGRCGREIRFRSIYRRTGTRVAKIPPELVVSDPPVTAHNGGDCFSF